MNLEKFTFTSEELAGMIDQTLLKPNVSANDFKAFCEDSAKYNFKMVAINSAVTKMCREYLGSSKVHVGAAIAFPLGQTTVESKLFETKDAIANGADEIDYVINIMELKSKNYLFIEDEMRRIVDICKANNKISKVIFENCYLTDEEKIILCEIALRVGPDFIKTSTGFGTSGAKLEDVLLMKKMVGGKIKVKAAGGIRSLEDALLMIEAGAERIGTSAGIKIVDEYRLSTNK
jgi:deoxyribose-phosphate aldolase